jgi:hypothetical protein
MFWLGMKYINELVMSDDPVLVHYQKTMDNFDKLIGDPIVRWINPSGVKLSKVYLDVSGKKMNGVMDQMIDALMLLLEWISYNVGTDKFNHSGIEARFCKTLAGWKDFGTDIAEFHLMLEIQICVLAGIKVRGHKDLDNLVYPVAKLGAVKQLEHIFAHECPMVLKRIVTEFGMDGYGPDMVKGMLCKTSEKCVTRILDVVMKGQYLINLYSCGFTSKNVKMSEAYLDHLNKYFVDQKIAARIRIHPHIHWNSTETLGQRD